MNKEELAKIRSIDLFKDLDDEAFEKVLKKLEEVRVPVNTYIFEAGDEGDCLYIILEGEVQVYLNVTEKHPRVTLSNLKVGDYFGEMALITGDPRSASVASIAECSLLCMEKKDFEQFLQENPAISLALSKSLSQRLKDANLKRVEAESTYISKMTPKGNLQDFSIVDVLKFCEHNSLTGTLRFEMDNEEANLEFKKGQLQKISLKDLEEDQAMDELLKWDHGTFNIETNFPGLAPQEAEQDKKPEKHVESKSKKEKKDKTPQEKPTKIKLHITNFSHQLIKRITETVGSRVLQDVVKKAYDSLKPYFPELENVRYSFIKTVEIKYNFSEEMTEREILSTAVFLQIIIENCKKYMVGSTFFDMEKIAGTDYSKLKEVSFFEYMAHALEFVGR